MTLLSRLTRRLLPAKSPEALARRGERALAEGDTGAALRDLRQAAGAGSTKAALALGDMFEKGKGTLPSAADAAGWFRQAADAGDANAQARYATLLLTGTPDDPGEGDALFPHGRGVKADPVGARSYALKAAEAGHVEGQALAAYLHAAGIGGPVSYGVAERLYRRAAEGGNIEAALGLGTLYAGGHVTGRGAADALPWFQKAAEQGNPTGQASLGILLVNDGKLAEAAGWFEKSAGQGNIGAMRRLGILLMKGSAADRVKGETWLRAAAGRGDREATQKIAEILDATDPVEATDWWRRAADAGDPRAQMAMALRHREGKAVPKDDLLAMRWLERAAKGGHVDAQFEMSVIYAVGRGVERDMAQAAAWSEAAAKNGHNIAKVNLGRYRMQGLGGPKDPDAAFKWLQSALDGGESASVVALGELFAFWRDPPDLKRARLLFQQGVAWGDVRAKELLARIS